MNARLFVSGTACFLLAWLALTYVRVVPHQGYPVIGRDGRPVVAGKPASAVEAGEVRAAVSLGGGTSQPSSIPFGSGVEVR